MMLNFDVVAVAKNTSILPKSDWRASLSLRTTIMCWYLRSYFLCFLLILFKWDQPMLTIVYTNAVTI